MSDATEVVALLTADRAYPAFERLVLGARERVSMGFRIFDPRTTLHSPEARAIGSDWFDLVAHTLSRGVAMDIVISDFDPIVRPDYHQRATRCVRQLLAAGEVSGRPDLLQAQASLHPARVGFLPSLLLWPRARGYLKRTVAELNAKTPAARDRTLSELPLLRGLLRRDGSGMVSMRQSLPRLAPVTHHQKLAVVDGQGVYIGGLDLNNRRFDTAEHDRPAEETWHDTQVLIHGPVGKAAQAHLRSFRAVTHGAAPPEAPGLLRTISRARRRPALLLSPLPVLAELAQAHSAQVEQSSKLIYLETQFMRDTTLARTLARRAGAEPGLNLIVVLPAAPDDVAFENSGGRDARYGEYLQAKCIDILMRGFGDRVFFGSPGQHRKASTRSRATIYGAPLIYLHSKVSIFDTRAAIVSSANLNGRSLNWDTEAGVMLEDEAAVLDLRGQCFAQWLGGPVPSDFSDPETAVAAWRARARQNIRRPPEDRRGFILPYASGPARRFGRSLPGIPEEMV
ncbi:phospholipase D1/2 [Jannaschia faecimaris]|uniref:Phospholipase D n=1 Tax=Jannaschia faecimaris TaxID=1244108 RepID=A0A1H3U5S9_9RHOB|nr:phospholipase D-like domain-containing protein [Jannaschia faecimaris]SDZ57844.1 phospholipase D1/2 [Jannaschia faecimaris]